MSLMFAALCALGADCTPLDLQPVANVSIKEGFAGNFANNNFATFETEEVVEKGVKFKFGKKFVAFLTEEQAAKEENGDKPKEGEKKEDGKPKAIDKIEGIKVGRGFASLHVVHSTQHAAEKPDEVIGWYTLHYKGGATHKFPIKYGKHVVDWWVGEDALDKKPSEGEIFWEGQNDAIKGFFNDKAKIRLYRSKFENPKPDVEVESIDLECADGRCRPFVFAMTVE